MGAGCARIVLVIFNGLLTVSYTFSLHVYVYTVTCRQITLEPCRSAVNKWFVFLYGRAGQLEWYSARHNNYGRNKSIFHVVVLL